MKRLLLAGIMLCLPSVVFAQTLNVHTTSGTTSYSISGIDSITFSVSPVNIDYVSIPAGNFTMGSTASDPYYYTDELPQHTVYLDAYQISKYEITNSQYKAFMDSGGYSNIAYWTTDGWTWRANNSITQPYWWSTGEYNSGTSFPNHPVVGVSWYEAYAFCNWAGGHLPTEAQWEKAARGTDARYYPWGNIWDSTKCNNVWDAYPDTFIYSSPAGYFFAGISPYGVYDMAGNVSEWISDWYGEDYYSISPTNNPTGPTTGISRVMRGGEWYCSLQPFFGAIEMCRNAFRKYSNGAEIREKYFGFRIAR